MVLQEAVAEERVRERFEGRSWRKVKGSVDLYGDPLIRVLAHNWEARVYIRLEPTIINYAIHSPSSNT